MQPEIAPSFSVIYRLLSLLQCRDTNSCCYSQFTSSSPEAPSTNTGILSAEPSLTSSALSSHLPFCKSCCLQQKSPSAAHSLTPSSARGETVWGVALTPAQINSLSLSPFFLCRTLNCYTSTYPPFYFCIPVTITFLLPSKQFVSFLSKSTNQTARFFNFHKHPALGLSWVGYSIRKLVPLFHLCSQFLI